MSDDDCWLDLQRAVARVREYRELSIGAALTVLRKACSSGEVRSRGRVMDFSGFRSRNEEALLPLLSENDWRDNSINLDQGELESRAGIFDITNVTVSGEDLDWWLRNRWKNDERIATTMPTGAPGRPSKGMHLIRAEFDRRITENSCKLLLREEATDLKQWFFRENPNAQSPTVKTIENNIRADHRQWALRQRPTTR
jgi:hypothetical protein